MLKDLLVEIKTSDYISKENIALKLDKPIELIQDGFDQLIRMGYIEEGKEINDCPSSCGGCPYARVCNRLPVNTIKLTEKGEKILDKKIV